MYSKVFFLALIFTLLLTACAQKPQLLGTGSVDTGMASDSGVVQNESNTAATSISPDQGGSTTGAIDSSGNTYTGAQASSGVSSAPGFNPDGTQEPELVSAGDWITYTDPLNSLSLKYPSLYTIVKEPASLTEINPDMIGRFRLLEPSLASGDTANLELPKFSIEIYSNVHGLSLNGWIDTNLPGGDLKGVQINGAVCTQVTLKTLMAPNQFIFCEQGNKVYKFTPMGLYSKEILASFKFGG